MRVDLNSIVAFLEALQRTVEGRNAASNMLDSCNEGIFPPDALLDFLKECSQVQNGLSPIQIFEYVCMGSGSKSKYLRLCRQSPFGSSDPQTLSNTVNTTNFNRHLLNRRHKAPSVGAVFILPGKPTNSPSGIAEYEATLKHIMSNPDWYEPGASIGRVNCWVTTNEFGPDPDDPPYGSDHATQVRDALGLIDQVDGTFLLRIRFPAAAVPLLTNFETARPTFSDLGGSRFRVSHGSPRASEYAKEGWGATVHLGKFGNKNFTNSTGESERVLPSIPLSELKSIDVHLLGRVQYDRGVTPNTDDGEAFALLLEAGRTTDEIRSLMEEVAGGF